MKFDIVIHGTVICTDVSFALLMLPSSHKFFEINVLAFQVRCTQLPFYSLVLIVCDSYFERRMFISVKMTTLMSSFRRIVHYVVKHLLCYETYLPGIGSVW